MSENRSLRKCFIVAPVTVDTGRLRHLLRKLNIDTQDALSLPPNPGSILSSIESAIRSADFVCAVVPSTLPANILFEIGLAYGVRKPLFLIVDRDVRLPIDLVDVFHVLASPEDIDAIEFNLQNFLEHIEKRTPRRRYVSTKRIQAIFPYAELLEEVQSLPVLACDLPADIPSLHAYEDNLVSSELERFVADLLKRTDTGIVRETHHPGSGADMAIWLDDIESTLGNPVLVEVKLGRFNERRLGKAETQLRRYLNNTNARVGLLLYLDFSGRRFPKTSSGWPLVIRLDVREFADIVLRGQLVNALIEERNKVVHGGL